MSFYKMHLRANIYDLLDDDLVDDENPCLPEAEILTQIAMDAIREEERRLQDEGVEVDVVLRYGEGPLIRPNDSIADCLTGAAEAAIREWHTGGTVVGEDAVEESSDSGEQSEQSEWVEVGTASVDSGMLMLADPCYWHPYNLGVQQHPRTWSEYLALVGEHEMTGREDPRTGTAELPHADGGGPGRGVTVSGFGGDGRFPVSVRRDERGQVVEVRIVFRSER